MINTFLTPYNIINIRRNMRRRLSIIESIALYIRYTSIFSININNWVD